MQAPAVIIIALLAATAGAFAGATAFPVTHERVEIVHAAPVADERPTPAPSTEPAPMLMGSDAGRFRDIEDILERIERSVESIDERDGEIRRGLEPVLEMLNRSRPSFGEARLNANETAAIATLRNIISAQAQFQASAKADQDEDGTGEYGGFSELSGESAGRMMRPLVPPVLSGAFRALNANGEVSRSGYFFRVYLCDSRGRPIGEPQEGFTPHTGVDSDLNETTWCAYAWPVNYGQSSKRTFFTNQGGDVTATDDPAYSGSGNGPAADAAFQRANSLLGPVAIGGSGSDTNTWVQVN